MINRRKLIAKCAPTTLVVRHSRLAQTALLALLAFGGQEASFAQPAPLNVLDFGAVGDALQILVNTVSNSTMVTFPPGNPLSNADVGKVIMLFGVGQPTTPTNNQDLLGQIVGVANGTNVTISMPAGRTAAQVPCTYGTQNAPAFQNCVNACAGTNTIVSVPPGNYLLIPPTALDPHFVMSFYSDSYPAVTISKGGIHFLGADPDTCILTGNGAWLLRTNWCYRGEMFQCLGPVTNSASPLVFENLTMDGGLAQGRPAVAGVGLTVDGYGWDDTHDAVVDIGTAPLHAIKNFVNCRFTNWRGEMLKSVVSGMDGYIGVTNCAFLNGSASGFNFNFTHRISGCTFSNLDMAMEFYAGYMLGDSVFENSIITNTRGGIVLSGALTNRTMPSYTIRGNSIAANQFGVIFGPAQNVSVTGNQFYGAAQAIKTDGAAYQGSACNSGISIVGNVFNGSYQVFLVGGAGADRIQNVVLSSNIAWNCNTFGTGYGWSSNIFFGNNVSSNSSPGNLGSGGLTGQWFLDDPSNNFPPNFISDVIGQTNLISYSTGSRQLLWVPKTNSVFLVDDGFPLQIPAGAQLTISNSGPSAVPVFLSNTRPGAQAVTLAMNSVLNCLWTNGAWTSVAQLQPGLGQVSLRPPPPTGLRILH